MAFTRWPAAAVMMLSLVWLWLVPQLARADWANARWSSTSDEYCPSRILSFNPSRCLFIMSRLVDCRHEHRIEQYTSTERSTSRYCGVQFKITFPTTRTLLNSFLQPLVYESSEQKAAALNLISRFSESRPTLARRTPALLPLTQVHSARPRALGACLGVSNTVAILRGGRTYSGTNEDIVVLRAGKAAMA